MELQDYFSLLKRRWWIPTLLAIIAGVAGYLLTPAPVTRYQAVASVLVAQPDTSIDQGIRTGLAEDYARTIQEFMTQDRIMQAVSDNLGLTLSPDELARKIRISAVSETNILRVIVTDDDPERAAAIANETINVFIGENISIQRGNYEDQRAELEDELVIINEDIRQKRIDAYEMQLSIDDIQSRIDNLQAQDNLSSTEQQELASLRTQYIDEVLAKENVDTEISLLERRSNSIYSSLESIRLALARENDFITVIDPAERGRAFAPQSRKPIVAAQSALAGMVLGLGIIFVSEQLRTVIRSTEEVERLVGQPALGFIATIKEDEGYEKLVAATKPRSAIAEAYRVVRTNIDFAGREAPFRTLLVTSSSPAEGKTLTTANLAATMASAGKRVILVDTDLRRPSLHKLFDVSNTIGVTTAISRNEDSPLTDHIGRTQVENLYIMPSGPLPPNPADILGGERMMRLINELRELADVVIFDSPPVLAVADPTLLAGVCDGTILVVLANSTRIDALRKVRERLEQSNANLVGAVLNRVSSGDNGYYQYYYYGHGD